MSAFALTAGGLNPCSNGILIEGKKGGVAIGIAFCLNPCSNGILSSNGILIEDTT